MNNLFLNYDKTVILLHSWKTNTLPTKTDFILHEDTCYANNIKCECKKINVVNNFKYLGIEMCSNMKWHDQINSLTQKTRKMIYIMREFRDILNKKELRLIYLALIEPIISYGIIGWGGSYENALSRLQTTQNTLIKIALSKDKTYNTEQLYEDFNVLDIKKIYFNSAVLFLKKHDVPLPLSHNVVTRFAKNNNYTMQWPHKTGTRKQYKFVGTKILNLIPKHFHALTLLRFKIDFKKWLLYEFNNNLLL